VLLPLIFVIRYNISKVCTESLREERRPMVFETGVLRGIFWPKGDAVTHEWRKLHNDKLNDLHFSLKIVRSLNREK
jgi:hypothetical protein